MIQLILTVYPVSSIQFPILFASCLPFVCKIFLPPFLICLYIIANLILLKLLVLLYSGSPEPVVQSSPRDSPALKPSKKNILQDGGPTCSSAGWPSTAVTMCRKWSKTRSTTDRQDTGQLTVSPQQLVVQKYMAGSACGTDIACVCQRSDFLVFFEGSVLQGCIPADQNGAWCLTSFKT